MFVRNAGLIVGLGGGRFAFRVRRTQINDETSDVNYLAVITAWGADSIVVVEEGGHMLYRASTAGGVGDDD
jgi:hypothetical protein